MSIATTVSVPTSSPATSQRSAFAILSVLFFMFGFLTCLNDILIPHLKALFTLNYTQVMLVQFCFFSAYFLVSLPSGWITSKLGYQQGTVIGLATAAVGALGFYPAAGSHSWPLFLLSLFVLAAGITLIQVSVNPYVTLLGEPEKASSRLNLVQAFNSLGTTLAPSFGAFFILKAATESSVQGPYLAFALTLFAIAIVFSLIRLPSVQRESQVMTSSVGETLQSTRLRWGILAIFCYVGAEVGVGSFLVSWLRDTRVAGLAAVEAGKMISFYWGGAMVGRFIGTWFLDRFKPARVLLVATVSAAALVVISMLVAQHVGMISMLLVGCFNSIMFPTIFALSLKDLGEQTARGSGFLCMAIVGGAILPLLQGWLADTIDLRWSFVVPVLGYCLIMLFARKILALEIKTPRPA